MRCLHIMPSPLTSAASSDSIGFCRSVFPLFRKVVCLRLSWIYVVPQEMRWFPNPLVENLRHAKMARCGTETDEVGRRCFNDGAILVRHTRPIEVEGKIH